MWTLLNTHCRLRVTQETTQHVLETLDPEGVMEACMYQLS